MNKEKIGRSIKNGWSDKDTAELFGESQGEGISIPLQIAIEYLNNPALFTNCQNMSQAKKLLKKLKSGGGDWDKNDLYFEKDIQEYIKHNWEKISLFREWESPECEYNTSIGRIDILARHGKDKRWLIIELKRDQSSDDTVGQILRYMGWIKDKYKHEGFKVEGLILSESPDKSTKYALLCVPDVKFMVFYFIDDKIKFIDEPKAFDSKKVNQIIYIHSLPDDEFKAITGIPKDQVFKND